MAPKDFRSVLQVLSKVGPNEIYNLSGQSSVSLSFDQPVETMESILIGTLNILESIRFLGGSIRFYNASSGETFGDTNGYLANERTPLCPRSPYAVAKAAAYWAVANYREAYDLYACSGILFNHESPLRPNRFVTKKIVSTAVRIAAGSKEKLVLGNMRVFRDWGWAPEYVIAMWEMLQQDKADDYIVSSGKDNSLEKFVEHVFNYLSLDYREHIKVDSALFRPNEVIFSCGDPSKAKSKLGWSPNYGIEEVVKAMVDSEKTGTVII